MATTLNISLPEEQVAWIKSRKAEAGYASVSDVFRDLIHHEREREQARLEAEFDELNNRDRAREGPPMDYIISTARKVRKRIQGERARGS
jgi:Arc/MetJ-type ribon-helix-helix transcriptional regulator